MNNLKLQNHWYMLGLLLGLGILYCALGGPLRPLRPETPAVNFRRLDLHDSLLVDFRARWQQPPRQGYHAQCRSGAWAAAFVFRQANDWLCALAHSHAHGSRWQLWHWQNQRWNLVDTLGCAAQLSAQPPAFRMSTIRGRTLLSLPQSNGSPARHACWVLGMHLKPERALDSMAAPRLEAETGLLLDHWQLELMGQADESFTEYMLSPEGLSPTHEIRGNSVGKGPMRWQTYKYTEGQWRPLLQASHSAQDWAQRYREAQRLP